MKGIAGEDEASDVIDDGERVAVAVIPQKELSFVVDGHQVIRFERNGARAQWMRRRVPATTVSNEICTRENVPNCAGCRPIDLGMQLCQPYDDLSRPHERKALSKRCATRSSLMR